ncbi:hypothetical protein [Alteribacter populi]|uniref:hypothetical protein n=1 Tax=Alteribacter populi TaxID=2011011 RepID=UPI000BBAA163|nr:hypothetical protein [Alteribacter populi]
MTKPKSTDWRSLPVAEWNVASFSQYLIDQTAGLYGVTYAPGGGGSKSQRWMREKGMLKQAQGRYGNEVLRRFIDLCLTEYAPKPEYPFAAFTFMYSYMDRNLTKAQAQLAEERRKEQARKEREQTKMTADEIDDYF